MNSIATRFCDTVLVDEKIDVKDGKEKAAASEETPSVRYEMNMFNCVLTYHKNKTEKQPSSDPSAHKKPNRHNLRSQGPNITTKLTK